MPDWVPVVVLCLPLLLVAGHLARVLRRLQLQRRIGTVPRGWVLTGGVVVDEVVFTRPSRGPDGSSVAAEVRQPVVRFRDAAGNQITFPSRIYAVVMPAPGSFVQVWYDPTDPGRARIAPVSLPTVGPPVSRATLVLALVAVLVLAVGALVVGASFLNL